MLYNYKVCFSLLCFLVIISYIFHIEIKKKFETKDTKLIKNKSQSQSFRKYVAISTSIQVEKNFYMFYLPVTCQSWRRIGFEPIIIMVLSEINDSFVDLRTYNYYNESQQDSKKINAELTSLQLKVIEYLKRLQVKIFYMRAFKKYEAQIGMLARIFLGYISKEYIADDNDYIITSDTDLIPINHEYYEFSYKSDGEITVWNGFCCGIFEFKGEYYNEYAMSHIGMKKYMWRNILTYDVNFNKFFETFSSEINFDRSSIVKVINELFGQNRFFINPEIGKSKIFYTNKKLFSVCLL